MENTNAVSIPLVDILSEYLGKRVVMNNNNKYIDFETLKEIPSTDIRAAESLKVEKSIKVGRYPWGLAVIPNKQ